MLDSTQSMTAFIWFQYWQIIWLVSGLKSAFVSYSISFSLSSSRVGAKRFQSKHCFIIVRWGAWPIPYSNQSSASYSSSWILLNQFSRRFAHWLSATTKSGRSAMVSSSWALANPDGVHSVLLFNLDAPIYWLACGVEIDRELVAPEAVGRYRRWNWRWDAFVPRGFACAVTSWIATLLRITGWICAIFTALAESRRLQLLVWINPNAEHSLSTEPACTDIPKSRSATAASWGFASCIISQKPVGSSSHA